MTSASSSRPVSRCSVSSSDSASRWLPARYDQRKNLEEEEANAIGTEYVRADLLPQADAAPDPRNAAAIHGSANSVLRHTRWRSSCNESTTGHRTLQNKLWAAVCRTRKCAANSGTSACRLRYERCAELSGLYPGCVVESDSCCCMGLMSAIAIVSNVLLGVGAHRTKATLFVVVATCCRYFVSAHCGYR